MSPRASLPGADELFRRTSEGAKAPAEPLRGPQGTTSTNLQVAPQPADAPRRGPKHGEKVTFYCTPQDLMALEHARLRLRAEHGLSADRGKIVRAALAYVLEDFEARAEDSILLRRLSE